MPPVRKKAGTRARPKNREVEYENLRPPKKEGEPPRPATEPPDKPQEPPPQEVVNDPGSGKPLR